MPKVTPVLFVEEVEPCLPFWERLGFERTIEVPQEDRLGFVALQFGEAEIMYQSRASLAADLPAFAESAYTKDGVSLFIQVDDLDAIGGRLGDAEVIFPERTTFYGAREIGVRAPCGTAVVFAEFGEGDEAADSGV